MESILMFILKALTFLQVVVTVLIVVSMPFLLFYKIRERRKEIKEDKKKDYGDY